VPQYATAQLKAAFDDAAELVIGLNKGTQ
jgi:hypothetical protein